MIKKLDINGVEPKIGDLIVYNPAYYKGVKSAICVGFGNTGSPRVLDIAVYEIYKNSPEDIKKKAYTPRTGFAVINITKVENIVHV